MRMRAAHAQASRARRVGTEGGALTQRLLQKQRRSAVRPATVCGPRLQPEARPAASKPRSGRKRERTAGRFSRATGRFQEPARPRSCGGRSALRWLGQPTAEVSRCAEEERRGCMLLAGGARTATRALGGTTHAA